MMKKPDPSPRVSIGTLVTNVKMEAWGPGKVLELSSTSGSVHFRDLPTGSQVRRIGVSYMAIAPEQSDAALDLIDAPSTKTAPRRKRPAVRKKKVVAAPPASPAEPASETEPESDD